MHHLKPRKNGYIGGVSKKTGQIFPLFYIDFFHGNAKTLLDRIDRNAETFGDLFICQTAHRKLDNFPFPDRPHVCSVSLEHGVMQQRPAFHQTFV